MGAEIFGVKLDFDGVYIAYADKVSIKRDKDTSSKNTFDGDVNFGAGNEGGTISIDHVVWPEDVADAVALENQLNNNNVKFIKCISKGYTRGGSEYMRVITGTDPKVSTDDEEWSPSEGISASLELTCRKIEKETK